MEEILRYPVETSLSMVDQLKLANKIASTVLKFYQTAWLGELFGIQDLSFFRQGKDLSGLIGTLHLGMEFAQSPQLMEGIESTPISTTTSQTMEDAMLEYGVRSLPLYSLSLVLLQIGRWSRIPDNDIKEVRRLARQPSRLGPKYQELTQKCLDCDFGYGSCLSKPKLQEAVYNSVICELSSMISCLDIND